MAGTRSHGPFGFHTPIICEDELGPARSGGPFGFNDAGDPTTRSVPGDTPGAAGTNNDVAAHLSFGGLATQLASMNEDDLNEYLSLRKYVQNEKSKEYKGVSEYLKHRNAYFGSEAQYRFQAAMAKMELDDNPKLLAKLRRDNENEKTHKQKLDERGLRAFYCWTRQAYKTKYKVTDVPKTILDGPRKPLVDALAAVRQEAPGRRLKAGLVARPEKSSQAKGMKFRLGTISEHAMGVAIHIDDEENPILSASDWAFLKRLTGVAVNESLAFWLKHPEGLWNQVNQLNEKFKTKVAEEVRKLAVAATKPPAGRAAPGSSTTAPTATPSVQGPAPRPKAGPALDKVLAGHEKLADFVVKHDGFFTLDLKLVVAMHKHGFRWGVTFAENGGSVDLHHFELLP